MKPTTSLAYSARQLSEAIGISLRSVRTLDSAGKLPRGIRFGRSKRWIVAEIVDWLAHAKPGDEPPDRKTWEALKQNGKAPPG